jgi:hypothetical protein
MVFKSLTKLFLYCDCFYFIEQGVDQGNYEELRDRNENFITDKS